MCLGLVRQAVEVVIFVVNFEDWHLIFFYKKTHSLLRSGFLLSSFKCFRTLNDNYAKLAPTNVDTSETPTRVPTKTTEVISAAVSTAPAAAVASSTTR